MKIHLWFDSYISNAVIFSLYFYSNYQYFDSFSSTLIPYKGDSFLVLFIFLLVIILEFICVIKMTEKPTVQEHSSQVEKEEKENAVESNMDWKYKLTHVGKVFCSLWLIL